MYIHARVLAGAKREEVTEKTPDHFVVHVREPAERNLANRKVVELLATHFGLSSGKVRIISGHHSPSKLLSIDIPD